MPQLCLLLKYDCLRHLITQANGIAAASGAHAGVLCAVDARKVGAGLMLASYRCFHKATVLDPAQVT